MHHAGVPRLWRVYVDHVEGKQHVDHVTPQATTSTALSLTFHLPWDYLLTYYGVLDALCAADMLPAGAQLCTCCM